MACWGGRRRHERPDPYRLRAAIRRAGGHRVSLLTQLQAAGEDFEWYPTTDRMIDAAIRAVTDAGDRAGSVLDIGAGDGRVLMRFGAAFESADLYGIEKSDLLRQAQPERVTPVGTDVFEQDLMSLPVDIAWCNPPYSAFETWACRIIDTIHTDRLFLVLPRRWKDSEPIRQALKAREAKATVLLEDDFLDAERRARAVVEILQITFPFREYGGRQDPFDHWFDQHIDTFDRQPEVSEYEQERTDLARLHRLDTIGSLVAAYDEDYGRMEEHYKAIFQLDAGILRELGVNKAGVRDGLKKRMRGLLQ
jgi:hypothetical protein